MNMLLCSLEYSYTHYTILQQKEKLKYEKKL